MRKERFVLLGVILFSAMLALLATGKSVEYPPETLFTFYSNATDDMGITKVEVFVDPPADFSSGSIGSCTFSGTEKIAPCTLEDEGPFDIGVHTYAARATDIEGQTSTSDYGSFIVNTTTVFAEDSTTTVTINPPTIHPGDSADIVVDFLYSGYAAGQLVRLNINISPDNIVWNSTNGCAFGGKILGPSGSGAEITWPIGTTSEAGHFNVAFTCTLPLAISGGDKSLVVTPVLP